MNLKSNKISLFVCLFFSFLTFRINIIQAYISSYNRMPTMLAVGIHTITIKIGQSDILNQVAKYVFESNPIAVIPINKKFNIIEDIYDPINKNNIWPGKSPFLIDFDGQGNLKLGPIMDNKNKIGLFPRCTTSTQILKNTITIWAMPETPSAPPAITIANKTSFPASGLNWLTLRKDLLIDNIDKMGVTTRPGGTVTFFPFTFLNLTIDIINGDIALDSVELLAYDIPEISLGNLSVIFQNLGYYGPQGGSPLLHMGPVKGYHIKQAAGFEKGKQVYFEYNVIPRLITLTTDTINAAQENIVHYSDPGYTPLDLATNCCDGCP